MLLSQLQQRLSAQVGHSHLLRLRLGAHTRVLDCRQFDQLSKGLSKQLVYSLINSKAAVDCDCPDNQHSLYEWLDKRIRRQAEWAQRETGVHALWLGYPLVHLLPPDGNVEQAVLAPVLLWPVQINSNLRKQGQLRIKRETQVGTVRSNPLLWTWLRRHYHIKWPQPDSDLDWTGLSDFLTQCAECLSQSPRIDIESSLVSVPTLKILRKSPSLINAAVLGYFHWPNAALLADLEALQSQDLEHSVLSGLLTRQHPPPSQPLLAPPEIDRFLVSDADFSQMQAVWQAREAPGLVIHGPPGTGKSQTIVNIIADTLAHQQRVLMVCQKQAALQVVHARLRDVGLASLCLHLSDADSDRLSVFREIRAQVEGLSTSVDTESLDRLNHQRQQLAQQITRLETTLDKHAQAVHVPHHVLQISYRDILAQSATLSQRFPSLRSLPSVQKLLEGVPASELDVLCEKILNLGHLYASADPHHNPWYQRQSDCRLNDHLLSLVKYALEELRERNAAHLAQLNTDRPPLVLPEKLAAFSDFIQRMMQATEQLNVVAPAHSDEDSASPDASATLVNAWWQAVRHSHQRVLQRHLTACEAALTLANEAEAMLSISLMDNDDLRHHSQFELDVLERQARTLLRYARVWWRWLLPHYHIARKALQAFAPAQASLVQEAEQLLLKIQQDRWCARLIYTAQTLVPGLSLVKHHDDSSQSLIRALRQAHSALHSILWLREQEQAQPWLTPLFDGMIENPAGGWVALQQQFAQGLQRLPLAEQVLQSIGKLQSWLLPEVLETPKRLVREGQDLEPWLHTLEQGLSQFPALLSLEAERQTQTGLVRRVMQALEHYEQARRQMNAPTPALPQPPEDLAQDSYGQWWEALLRFSRLQSALNRCLQDAPSLQALTPQAHADTVEKLEAALLEKKALEADYIRQMWWQQQVPLRSRPWKRIFQLRSSRQAVSKRMREAVIAGHEEGLLQLRPCWLTNPETAAQIFPLIQQLFDVVIFDEASQCPLEQALPIIHRGQRLIVCGDEKQLPPTGFFTAHLEGDFEDSESSSASSPSASGLEPIEAQIDPYLLQAEDLLQAASGHLRETYLRVHYRSTHPALIDFSNQAFYHGLLDIPPVCDVSQHSAVHFYAVNGVYEKRQNQAEAEQVLARLREYWLTDEALIPSIGVITFNQVQRDLIEDKLSQLCQQDDAFARAYQREVARSTDSQGQGFFVKNLENVQGDERDVIIFSTTFGTDRQGHFYRRFGPLGASGGERRLNVGITRAKQRVELLCSLPLHDITEPDTVNESLTPAAYLQLYLQYAQALSTEQDFLAQKYLRILGTQAPHLHRHCQTPPALLQDIQTYLSQWGYTSQVCVGSGSLGIDLAVKAAEQAGFILGVECDGSAYFRERDNRLRDIWRVRLLQQRGWRLHRIWSERWWNAKATELARLKKALEPI